MTIYQPMEYKKLNLTKGLGYKTTFMKWYRQPSADTHSTGRKVYGWAMIDRTPLADTITANTNG